MILNIITLIFIVILILILLVIIDYYKIKRTLTDEELRNIYKGYKYKQKRLKEKHNIK